MSVTHVKAAEIRVDLVLMNCQTDRGGWWWSVGSQGLDSQELVSLQDAQLDR